jgi:hypothetical protein
MDVSPKSSSFRMQLSAARMFGLVETFSGHHKLSLLGRMIVDPQREREARARAFQNVPLFKAIFDNYKGGVLPPAAALEREMVGMGVAEKQTSKARQVFERSAEQGGYFEHGKSRLVMPAVAVRPDEAPPAPVLDEQQNRERNKGGGGGGDMGDHDPLILGLFQKLPEPDTDWSSKDRLKWLQTAANIFDLVYKGEGGIVVSAARADRSPRHDE